MSDYPSQQPCRTYSEGLVPQSMHIIPQSINLEEES